MKLLKNLILLSVSMMVGFFIGKMMYEEDCFDDYIEPINESELPDELNQEKGKKNE